MTKKLSNGVETGIREEDEDEGGEEEESTEDKFGFEVVEGIEFKLLLLLLFPIWLKLKFIDDDDEEE